MKAIDVNVDNTSSQCPECPDLQILDSADLEVEQKNISNKVAMLFSEWLLAYLFGENPHVSSF